MSGEYERTQDEEMELAFKEKRQPLCVYCEKPLNRILQTQYENIEWDWDARLKIYVKQEYCGDSDPPYHASCWCKDWAFVDERMVGY